MSAEKLALIHNQWTVKLNELAKEVSRYAEELHKKHKQVKDEEAPTLAAVKTVQVHHQEQLRIYVKMYMYIYNQITIIMITLKNNLNSRIRMHL